MIQGVKSRPLTVWSKPRSRCLGLSPMSRDKAIPQLPPLVRRRKTMSMLLFAVAQESSKTSFDRSAFCTRYSTSFNSIMARRAGKKPPSALLNKVKAAATGANGASAVNGNASTVRPAKEEDPAVKEQRERQQSLENRQLASKEAALFKQLLTLYETKQHKKGVKTAEQILKKYPNHGGEDLDRGLREPYSN